MKLQIRKMKLTLILTLLVFVTFGNSFSQVKLSLQLKKATIQEVIETIEDQTDYIFLYKDEILDLKQRYSIDFEETLFEDVLNSICETANVDYEVRDDRQIILKEKVKNNSITLIQDQKSFTGVVSGSDGQPIPGVSVIVKGTTTGAVTDLDGKFQFEGPASAQVLQFSFVGLRTQDVEIGTQSIFNIVMEEETLGIDEVIVVGYGTQKKSDITGTVASLSQERLEMVPNLNVTQAIQGAVPGVMIQTNSAGADPDQSIMIRGRSSISASSAPLIIVDGIPYGGSLSDINLKDIGSVEILKDASAAAIYGSRGSNGVILITTKEGVSGKTTFSYDGKYGISQVVKNYDLLNGSEFWDFKNTRDPDYIYQTEIDNYNAGVSTDWLDLAIRKGQSQEHNVSVSGGYNKTKFYLGAGLTDIKGVAKGDNFTRITTRLNIETKLFDWLAIGTRTQLNYDDASGEDVSWYGAMIANPLGKPYDDNGNYLLYPIAENITITNPLTSLAYDDLNKSYQILTNNYLDVDVPFIEGLTYRLNTGVRTSFTNAARYGGMDTYNGFRTQGQSRSSNSLSSNVVIENIMNYNRTLGDHTIFLTGLYSYETNTSNSNSLSAEQFPNDFLSWYGVGQAAIVMPSTSYRKSVLLSQMLRGNYSFASKYLATFTIRRDGYSAFGEDSKWGIFPSFAVGWNIDRENFFPAKDLFSVLKLRVSYGLNGNQAISPYASLPKFTVASIMSGTTAQVGYKPMVMGVADLGWESTKTFNVGLDFGLLESRITGNIDWYRKNTFDLLLNRSISRIHGLTEDTDGGIPSVIQNIGETMNTGFEVSLNSRNIVTEKFKWATNANFSYNKNEITSLYGTIDDVTGKEIDDISNKWFIGQPVEVNYDFVWDGIWQLGEEAEAAVYGSQPGYVKLKDINNDGKLDDKDRQVIGQRDPSLLWGLTNTLTYGNISFSFFFHGVKGVTAHNDRMTDSVQDDLRYNTIKKNWWTPDNPSNDWYMNSKMANQMSGIGSTLYESTDFIRLKDVSLAYQLPKNVVSKIGMSNVKIYVSGRNLLTFTDWSGLDPELVDRDAQRNIPMQKEFIFGLNFGF
ncbi:MAG: SusC/RagA family TonB-linked outer membrane protein [Prolixibacteraceae bacterium]|nr:SusC/RagA family TonB-linked outer membrane protein [Prolixibacteraceae bacterium]